MNFHKTQNSNFLKITFSLITLLLLIINTNSIYFKLEQDREKCFLDEINKGSVIKTKIKQKNKIK